MFLQRIKNTCHPSIQQGPELAPPPPFSRNGKQQSIANTKPNRERYRSAWIGLFIALLPIIFLAQWSNLDLRIEDYYFDAKTHSFYWKNAWLAKILMHVYVKDILIAFAGGLLALTALDWLNPIRTIDAAKRLRLRFVVLSAVLIPSAISLLKQSSPLHCPWDIARYGGESPYVRLMDMYSVHQSAGHCFPAGHASSGLWLAAFCVFWLPHSPRKALLVFIAGLSVGLALGWVQQMRGAHFLTHTLASAWVATFIILILLSVFKEIEV